MKQALLKGFHASRNAAWPLVAWRASKAQFPEPVFIVSPPRSGSIFLFECLAQFPGIFHHREEANEPWRRGLRPVADSSFHDAVLAPAITDDVAAEVYRHYYRGCVFHTLRTGPFRLRPGHLAGTRPIRYLDKTIGNCFRLNALKRMFPDAQFIFLRRDPRETISSMIQGWPDGRFLHRYATPVLGQTADATLEKWSYPAPPGWFDHRGDSLARACCWSWVQHMKSILAFEAGMPESPCRVRYEDLTMDLSSEIERLAGKLHMELDDRVAFYLRDPPLSKTTNTKPRTDKWKADKAVLREWWHLVADTAAESGYPDPP